MANGFEVMFFWENERLQSQDTDTNMVELGAGWRKFLLDTWWKFL